MLDYIQAQVIARRFQQLGFNQVEITEFLRMLGAEASFSVSTLQSYGYSFKQADRLKYMFDIFIGKVRIETQDEIARHLRKMSGGSRKISMRDFPKSQITNIPRIAVIANIKPPPFDIWNSKNYKGGKALYQLVDVSGQRITVETARKPQFQQNRTTKIQGIFEIKGVKANGNIVVTFNKKYCSLCNRFVIVGSLRNPEYHLGKYEMLCFEGTKVYVYALNIGTKEAARFNSDNYRIYDFGLLPNDIEGKLKNAALTMYNQLKCVLVKYCEPNDTFRVVDCDKKGNS